MEGIRYHYQQNGFSGYVTETREENSSRVSFQTSIP